MNTSQLTTRENEVMLLIGKGCSNRKIADILGIQEQSVKNLVSVILRKLHCENRTQVALFVVEQAANLVD